MIFLDTNVLIYAAGLDGEEDKRTAQAMEIVTSGQAFAISIQVIQEFFDNAIRPKRPRCLTVDEALGFVAEWRKFDVVPLTLSLFDEAIAIRQRYKFRYWDCAILAAASAAGCSAVFTEDMQHEQVINGMQIINPFC